MAYIRVQNGLGQADSVSRGSAYIEQRMKASSIAFASQMAPIMAKLSEDMKKKVEQQVAATTAAILAINAIPVVGTILSGIASVAASISGDKYQRKIQEVFADFKAKTARLQNDYNNKAKDEITQIVKSIEDDAIKLALSGAPLPEPEPNAINGLDGLGIGRAFKRVGRSINRAVSKIGREIGRPFEQAWDVIEKGINALSGKAAYEKARDAAARGWSIAQSTYKTAYGEILSEVRSPQYKNDITIDMARSIRQDPDIQALIKQKQEADRATMQNAQEIQSRQKAAQKTQQQYQAYQQRKTDPNAKKIEVAPLAAAAVIPVLIALVT